MSKFAMEMTKKLDPEMYEKVYGRGDKKGKYKAERTGEFDSKFEASVYEQLRYRELAGEITDIKRQVPIVLQDGPPKERIQVKIDFTYVATATGQLRAAEAKGFATERWVIILKLWRRILPMPLEIWKGDHRKPRIVEVIE